MEKQASSQAREGGYQTQPAAPDTSILVHIPDLRRLSLDELAALIALRARYHRDPECCQQEE